MRIDPNLRTSELPESKGPDRAGGAGSAAVRSGDVRPDQANLTGGAKVAELRNLAQQLPEVRQRRVEALARALRDGQYEVSSEQVADALLSEILAKSSVLR
ncbi:MAG TPA: flagellar biosynthesis anti-sigma factor FlgM [Terriglobales bacterium]